MDGKVCLVTGGTAGLGLVTARELAQRGSTVVLVGRDPARCEQARREIVTASSNQAVDWIVADLSSQADVRALAAEVERRYDRLDILVNNAGALFTNRRESVDGIEMTLALNHLAYFLLTELLQAKLQASAPSRIVNVSSVAHERVVFDFSDVQSRRYRAYQVYARSKLANLLFTYELARRLTNTGVTVNAVNPGLARTGFGANNGWLGRVAVWLVHLRYHRYVVSAERGAETIVYLATSPEVSTVSGRYFADCRAVASSPASYDRDAAARLWQISTDLTGQREIVV